MWDAGWGWLPRAVGLEEEGERFEAPWLLVRGWSWRSGLLVVAFLEALSLCWAGGRLVWQLGWVREAGAGQSFALFATAVLLALLAASALTLIALILGGVQRQPRFLLPYLILQSLTLGPLAAILSQATVTITPLS